MSVTKSYGLGNDGRILYGSDNAGAAVSTGTPVVSRIVDMRGMSAFTIQLVVPAGTLAGTWLIEYSNNWNRSPAYGQGDNSGNWTTSSLTIPAATAAGQNDVIVPPVPLKIRAVRVTFTRTSGSGVPEVWICAGSVS
jgi:hypothetical protein